MKLVSLNLNQKEECKTDTLQTTAYFDKLNFLLN